MVQIYIYVFSKIADFYFVQNGAFVSKLGRLLLFEGISSVTFLPQSGFPSSIY